MDCHFIPLLLPIGAMEPFFVRNPDSLLAQFFSMPWVFSGLIIVGGFVSISLLGLWATRLFVSSKALKASHDVAGYTFGTIGVIYAVLLGFIVVQVNDRFQDAEKRAIQEAAILIELFRDTAVFPAADKRVIQRLIHDYAEAIYGDEWPKMAQGEESELAKEFYRALWEAYKNFTPRSDKEKIWYQESLSKLNQLSQERITRLFTMRQSLGPMMWTLLLMGAFITVFFMCFFSTENRKGQAIMMGLLSGTIAFMLFLIMNLEGVYSGNVQVRATEFQEAIAHFEESLKGI